MPVPLDWKEDRNGDIHWVDIGACEADFPPPREVHCEADRRVASCEEDRVDIHRREDNPHSREDIHHMVDTCDGHTWACIQGHHREAWEVHPLESSGDRQEVHPIVPQEEHLPPPLCYHRRLAWSHHLWSLHVPPAPRQPGFHLPCRLHSLLLHLPSSFHRQQQHRRPLLHWVESCHRRHRGEFEPHRHPRLHLRVPFDRRHQHQHQHRPVHQHRHQDRLPHPHLRWHQDLPGQFLLFLSLHPLLPHHRHAMSFPVSTGEDWNMP
mmetsp:Transcript_63198/g.183145  ORF Transcript_63198/g.183145 Transcript_63198/m.183145 type:complete len:265 (-) Transcript_63198:162-956(-)